MFALIVAAIPVTASAYITPGQFLGEEPSGGSASSASSASSAGEIMPIPNLVPDENDDDFMIPELIPNENSNLPSNTYRETRIPDRPSVEPVETAAPTRPTRRAIQESAQPVERVHNATNNLPSSGLPLALPAALSLICTGGGFYTFRKISGKSI